MNDAKNYALFGGVALRLDLKAWRDPAGWGLSFDHAGFKSVRAQKTPAIIFDSAKNDGLYKLPLSMLGDGWPAWLAKVKDSFWIELGSWGQIPLYCNDV